MKTINFITTNTCNANCSFCFEKNKKHFKPRFISKKTIDLTIHYFFNLWKDYNEVISIDLFGGEPSLAEKECIYIVNKAEELSKVYNVKFKVLLFTNAFHYPEKLINLLLNKSILTTIQISNEGVDNFLKDNNNMGLRNKIHNNIRRYVSTGIPFNVRATMSSQCLTSAENLLDTIKLMQSLGVKSFYFFPIMEHGWTSEHMKIWKNGFELITDYLFSNYKENPDFDFSFTNYFHEVTDEIPPLCGAGSDYIAVDTDGKVYACQRFLPISKDVSESIGDVYERVYLNPIGNIEAHESCRSCRVKNCKVCPAVSYDSTGLNVSKGDYCKIREIFWDEYMNFATKMKTIGQYNVPTQDEIEQLRNINTLEMNFFTLFNRRDIDIESGFNIFNTRLTYKQNLIRIFSRMINVFMEITNDNSIIDHTLTNEDEILEHLVKSIDLVIQTIYDENIEYKFFDIDTSIVLMSAIIVVLLGDKNGTD